MIHKLFCAEAIPAFYLGLGTLDLSVIMMVAIALHGQRDLYFAAVVPLLWFHLLFCFFQFSFKMEEHINS